MKHRIVALWSIAAVLAVTFVTPASDGQANGEPAARTLVIVHPPVLNEAAKAWAEYRTQRGWRVRLEVVSATTDADADRAEIRERIHEAFTESGSPRAADFAVLLLGDDDALPAWRFPQFDPLLLSDDDREYITDQPYQLADGDNGRPDFPLGRVPARDAAQALACLRKIQAHERAALSPPTQAAADDLTRRRITYVAGEGRFGPMDALLEAMFIMMVDRFVPDAFDLSMTYAKASSIYCPPPSQLRTTVLQRLSEGAILFNYVGHGHDRGLDSLHWNNRRIPILRVGDLQRLDDTAHADRARPIAFMSCCSVGHFDLAGGEPCLSEALLFHPAGPIAVISGSRITHPYANTVLQKDITHALLVERAPTAGMLDLLAERSLLTQDATDRELDFIAGTIARSMQWQTSLRDLRSMHARMYNLLGDPATELVLPPMSVQDLKVEGRSITGRVDGMKSGRITLRIETPRVLPANAATVQPLVGTDDPDLERKAAINYPLANDRLLLQVQADVREGAFAIELAAPLPPNAGAIRAYATGVDNAGMAMEAIGALRLQEATDAHGATHPQ